MVCKCIEGIRYMRNTAEKTHGCSERGDANGGCGLWLSCGGGVVQWVQVAVPGEAGQHSWWSSLSHAATFSVAPVRN